MYWYHISLCPVEEFTPRIPQMTYETENRTIPRICVTTNLQKAFQASPQMGNILRAFLDNGMHPVIYVYRFYKKDYKHAYLSPSEIKKHVMDAEQNEEYWLTKKPERVSCKKVIVTDAIIRMMKDSFHIEENFCMFAFLSETKTKKTNEEILLDFFKGKKYEEFVKEIMKSRLSLRKKICFMLEQDLLKYKEEA